MERTTPATSEKRVALVIGNSAYKTSPLKNPSNDARDMAAKLRTLGFEVIERSNITTRQIGSTMRELRTKLTPGSVALIFYAGHGVQIKGDNYLPTVDAEIETEDDVPNQSLALTQIMQVLDDAKTRLNLVFLDACRNNPYARSFRSGGNGLSKVNAPTGTLISFATRPGSVASDGAGRNGLYTEHLLKAMDIQGLQIELALKRVVSAVKGASNGSQEPWMEGSIEGDFYFSPTSRIAGPQVANIAIAPSQQIGGITLDDLRQQQELRNKWDRWQVSMKADFDKVAALNVAPDLQIAAWDRFLTNYKEKNPFLNTDDDLRSDARNRKQMKENERMQRLESVNISVSALGAIVPATEPDVLGSTAVQAQQKLKWAHVYETSEPYHTESVWAAEEIKKRSNGKFDIKVFPASTLGKETDINQGLTLGTVDIIISGLSFAARTYPRFGIAYYPFIFRDADHLIAYSKSRIFQEMVNDYRAKTGIQVTAYTYYGARHTTAQKAFTTCEGMKSIKIRVPDVPAYRATPEACGANPTPIAFAEVYLALQNGTVEAQENPLTTIEAKKFFEVQKAIMLTGHIVDGLTTQVAPHLWNRLNDSERKIFTDVTQEAAVRATAKIKAREAALIDSFKKKGLQIVQMDRKSFQEAVLKNKPLTSFGFTQSDFDKIQLTQ